MTRTVLTMAAALSLAACAGREVAPAKKVAAPDIIVTPSLGNDEILSRIGSLPAQRLEAGECGLFLWLKRDDAPLVYFQRSDGRAYMAVDGSLKMLDRTRAERPISLQYFEEQTFTVTDLTLKVSVTPESVQSLQQGLKLPSGSLSVQAAGGWQAVLPVAGVIGCK